MVKPPEYRYIVNVRLLYAKFEPTDHLFKCNEKPEIIDGIFRVYIDDTEHGFPVNAIYYSVKRVKKDNQ